MDASSWNQFIAARGGTLRQSWEWGEFQNALGRAVRRWQSTNGVCAAQMIAQPLPLGHRYWYLPRGPMILGDDQRFWHDDIKELLDFVRREGKALFVRCELGQEKGHPFDATLNTFGFHLITKGVQPQETLLIDLAQDEEAILTAMHHKTRYNIRLAERHGVEMQEAQPETLEALWPLFETTAARDGFSFHAQSYYEKMCAALSPRKEADDAAACVRLWVAAKEGTETLAVAIIGYFAKTAVYLHGASSSAHRNLMAPYLLHWQIMQDAKQRGFATYDFGGISDTVWPGVTRFKRGFGGQPFTFAGVFDLPLRHTAYAVYRILRSVMRQ